MINLALNSKRVVVFTPQIAAATTLTSGVLDMQDFDSVIFDILLAALTAGQTKGTVTVNAGNQAGGGDMAPLGPNPILTIQDADTGKLEAIEVVKPVNFRYVQLVITRNSQAAAISSVVATFFAAHKKPTSDDATTVAQTYCVIDPEYASVSGLTTTTTTYPGSTTNIVNTYRSSS